MSDTPSVLYAKETITVFSPEMIPRLKSMATSVPLKRARLCLHLSKDDLVQEMVIVLHRDTYVRPHRHPDKSESFHMIEGAVLIVFFDESGGEKQRVTLSADGKNPFLYRMSAPYWHAVLPLTEFAVFQEVTTGPFSPSEYPSWEPHGEEEIRLFKERLLTR